MEHVELNVGIEVALDAIFQNRLAAICGAGLSMAAPSSLPSAWTVAQRAKSNYDALFGAERPPLSDDIEEQAEFFRSRNQLSGMYLRTLIDPDTFSGPSNGGHFSIADMLLTSAMQLVLSTNVDTLIEQAGDILMGGVGVATTRDSAAAIPDNQSVLLKIHGCWKSNLEETVWAPRQLEEPPLSTRIPECAEWVTTKLLNKDILIIGYFTDWDYLNRVLQTTLLAVHPSNVIVIDPSTTADLQGKAPALFELGENSTNRFLHVQVSGDYFLQELRKQWSLSYLRKILHSGYALLSGMQVEIDETLREPPDNDVDSLWLQRRDLEGCFPGSPCRKAAPNDEPVLGHDILRLLSAGATVDGQYWKLGDQKIRVINSSSQALHQIKKQYSGDTSPVNAPDITIASGATDFNIPANVSRSGKQGTVVRPGTENFMTFSKAAEALGI